MAEALLRTYLNKSINKSFNLYCQDRFCYSPTMYVLEGLSQGPDNQRAEKVDVLRAYGAGVDQDIFYAATGRQPGHARGVPKDLWSAEVLARHKDEQLAEAEAEHKTRLHRMRQLAQEAERAKQRELEQQLERSRAIEFQEQENLKTRHDLNRALRSEDWEDEQSRELERQTMAKHERSEELEHQSARARAALSQQKLLYGAEQDHHRQIKYQDYLAIEQQVKLQKRLEQQRDSYHANQHERKMKELTMASAIPIGAPYMLEGQNGQRAIEY